MSRCWKPPRPASLLVLGLANANTNLGSCPSFSTSIILLLNISSLQMTTNSRCNCQIKEKKTYHRHGLQIHYRRVLANLLGKT